MAAPQQDVLLEQSTRENSIDTSKSTSNSKAKVLIVSFEHQDDPIFQEDVIGQLKDLYVKKYIFDVALILTPLGDYFQVLEVLKSQFLAIAKTCEENKTELLIFHLICHGCVLDGQLYLSGTRKFEKDNLMKWNFFLNELKTFNTHIFAILDFCHSGKALNDTVADRGGKRMEFIAACEEGEEAWTGDYGLTQFTIDILETSDHTKPASITDFATRLQAHVFNAGTLLRRHAQNPYQSGPPPERSMPPQPRYGCVRSVGSSSLLATKWEDDQKASLIKTDAEMEAKLKLRAKLSELDGVELDSDDSDA